MGQHSTGKTAMKLISFRRPDGSESWGILKDAGIVDFGHAASNQRGEIVAECRRQALMRKRPSN